MARGMLVALVVAATAGFAIGTSIERHDARAELATGHVGDANEERGNEERGNEQRGNEASEARAGGERHAELRPLGVDVEAVPFVVVAALGSLALAALVWARPTWLPGLVLVVVAMLVFALLDVREAFHQSDEARTGLLVLAAAIAALHLMAAGIAGRLAGWHAPPVVRE